MAAWQIVERTPTPAEYNWLRTSVGWRLYAEEVIAAALPNSLFCLCAYQGDELVGMARVIGDGGLVYYIQDVIVIPAWQGRGIGSGLMDRVMAYIEAHAAPNSIVGLISALGKEAFYGRYGFIARPTERLGPGMTTF